jgi:hypothetical protein
VGIGTSSPGTLLHINYNGSETNDIVDMLTLTALSTGTTTTGFGAAIKFQAERNNGVNQNTGRISSVAEVNSGTNISSGLGFWTSTVGALTERLRISYDGKVGIGTSSPDAELHIEPVGSNASLLLSNNGRTQYWRIQNNEADDALVFNANDASERMRITSAGVVEIPHLYVDKSYTYLDNATITGTFVSGAAPNTWHSITNLGNIGNGLGGGYGGETMGIWVRIFWTSGSTSAGYNHNLLCFIPPGTSNTHESYSGSSFETSHIGGVSYTQGLAFTVKHHTSTPGGHDIRLRLFNDGAGGSGLNLQIYTQTSVGSSNAQITIWRAS